MAGAAGHPVKTGHPVKARLGDSSRPFYPGIAERIATFVAAARAEGRDVPVTVFFYGVGTPDELDACAQAGAVRCVFYTANDDRETLERDVTAMERSIRAFNDA